VQRRIQYTIDIQTTFAQMQNTIFELMQTNDQLCHQVAKLHASQQLLQLKNDKLSNNVNVNSKSTQKKQTI